MKSILVIDDDDDVRSVVVGALTQAGFTVREAKNGREGLQLVLAKRPDLIVCDVRMPGIDGYLTLAAIRQVPATAAIPFILMTGSEDKDGFRRGMVRGADDYLMKPFSPDELVEAVMSRFARQTDFQTEAFQRAKSLRDEAVHRFSEELAVPIKGIMGVANSMMREHSTLRPDRVFASARQIHDSVLRVDRLARSMAH